MGKEFEITGISKISLQMNEDGKTSKHLETLTNIELSDNVDPEKFFTQEGIPNEMGSKALTHCLIQGLVANIHYAHDNGLKDSAEHLREIIRELEDGFVRIGKLVTVYKEK